MERRREAMEITRIFRNDVSSGDFDGEDVVELIQSSTDAAPAAECDDAFDDELDERREDHAVVTAAVGAEDPPPVDGTNPRTVTSFRSFASDPNNRIPLMSSILLPVAQQLSGINAVFYYSTAFFDGVIANPQTGTIIAFTVNVGATIVAVLVMDRLGRKTLLSLSAGGMLICCVIMTLSLEGSLPPLLAVVGVMLYILFFELGLGCIPFFLASEMIDSQFLGRVQSIGMSCNWISNFLVGLLFPYMDRYLGPFSFVPFALFLFGTVLFCVFVLPESRGKSPREVTEELAHQRRSRGH